MKVRMAPTKAKPAAKLVHTHSKDIKPSIQLDEESGSHFFVLGTLKCPVDGRDLARTIGAGQFGYGEGLLDRWSDNVWREILTWMGLPAEPLIRPAAKNVIARLVQRAWLEHFDPRMIANNEEKMAARDAAARTKYLAEFGSKKEVHLERKERARTNLKGGGFAKREYVYTPTKELPKDGLKGQQGLVLAWFRNKKNKDGGTCEHITADLVAAGFTCNQDPNRAIYYYLNEWKKKGWLEAK